MRSIDLNVLIGAIWSDAVTLPGYAFDEVPAVGEKVDLILDGEIKPLIIQDIRHTLADDCHYVDVLLWLR